MPESAPYQFESHLETSTNKIWGAHFGVPQWVADALLEGSEDRRVVCRLNDRVTYQCAMLPRGDGSYLITVNKKIRTQLRLEEGTRFEVSLEKDESEFGLPFPEELEELLAQDPEGNKHFDALTPGKKRNLLYIVGQPRRSETRLSRALAVVDHLKENGGVIDFKRLNVMVREYGKRGV